MTAPTMKQRLALRLFIAVTEDTEAAWEGLTDEERQDALKWAEQALDELKPPTPAMRKAGGQQVTVQGWLVEPGTAANVWDRMVETAQAEGT